MYIVIINSFLFDTNLTDAVEYFYVFFEKN